MTHGPQFGWTDESLATAFDNASTAVWYSFGVQQSAPMFALQDSGAVEWIDASAGDQTVNVYYGKQRPFIVLTYFLMGGLPIYHAFGNKDYTASIWTFTPLQTTGDTLPVYQCRYQDDTGINDVILSQMNNKTHSLRLVLTREWPMIATEMIMGTDRWTSNNSNWEDGATSNSSTSNFLTTVLDDPTNFYTGNDVTAGFELDSRSVVTINSIDVAPSLVGFEANISMNPKYGYIQGTTFQEEIWPDSIIERPLPIPMGLQFDMLAGVETTTLKNAFSATDFTINAKFYSQDATRYIEFNTTTSNYKDAFIKMADPVSIGDRLQRVRFYCPYTGSNIKMVDGVTAIT